MNTHTVKQLKNIMADFHIRSAIGTKSNKKSCIDCLMKAVRVAKEYVVQNEPEQMFIDDDDQNEQDESIANAENGDEIEMMDVDIESLIESFVGNHPLTKSLWHQMQDAEEENDDEHLLMNIMMAVNEFESE